VPREAVLLRTLVELADNLVDDFDVIDVLTTLNMRCVETFDVAAAGVMLAAPSGQLHVVASSTDTMRVLELFELQANEGPCVDCHRSGLPIVNLELSANGGRWPRFSVRALAEGFNSVHALPMRFRSQTIGALNMFRSDAGALNEDDVIAAQALADVASIAIAQHHAGLDAQVLNDQLNQALTGRTIIEQAKGRISEALGVDMDEAFQRLRHHARVHHLRLTDLAHDIADGTIPIASLKEP
jgi:GAF domain-containing protein